MEKDEVNISEPTELDQLEDELFFNENEANQQTMILEEAEAITGIFV